MNGIDPKISTWLNVGAAGLGVVATLSPSMFPSYIPPGSVADIIKTAGVLTTMLGGLNGVLHSVSGPGGLQRR